MKLEILNSFEKKSILILVGSEDSVLKVKESICNQEGIPIKEQNIFSDGRLLSDAMKLSELSSCLYLAPITVGGGDPWTLTVKVKNGENTSLTLYNQGSTTVRQIKECLSNMWGQPIESIKLKFKGIELDDDSMQISGIDIKDKDKIKASVSKFSLKVVYNNQNYYLKNLPKASNTTIKELKKELKDEFKLKKTDIISLKTTDGQKLDQEESTLADNGISKVTNEIYMQISSNVRIVVKTDANKEIQLELPSSFQTYIKALKEQISYKLYGNGSQSINLYYQGKLLEDAKKAQDYHFTENCVIYIEHQSHGGKF